MTLVKKNPADNAVEQFDYDPDTDMITAACNYRMSIAICKLHGTLKYTGYTSK